MTDTCTVIIAADGTRCGRPAVASFTSKRTGERFHECREHCVSVVEPTEGHTPAAGPTTAASLGIVTRSTSPFVLVRDRRIVGYALAVTPAVERRARNLGATIMVTR